MNHPDYRIPEDKAQEVFTLAAQLYAQHSQSYSVNELMEAGAEAKIPPEFIQQAIEELQLQHRPTDSPIPTPQAKPSKTLLISLALGVPALVAIGLVGWFLARNTAINAQVQEPPVETVNPIPTEGSEVSLGQGNFKCSDHNLEGENLSGRNLRDADCTRANLARANLSNANLEGANLSHADLENANLSGANLKEADLAGADLAGANLDGANLDGANLSNSDLKNANLRNANLREADLANAELDGAELDGANTDGTNFNGVTGNFDAPLP